MEVQTTTGVDSAAPATQAPAVAMPDVGSMTEQQYSTAKSSYEKDNGPGSWLNRDIAAPAKPANGGEPQTNGNGAKPAENGSEPADDGMEPGEVTINADGQAIDKKTGRFVPKSAFLRVKGELGEYKGKAEGYATELIKARERLSIFQEASQPAATQQPAAKEAPKAVDPKEDIFGAFEYLAHQNAELQKRLEKSETGNTETRQSIERQQLQSYASQDAAAFKAKTPDVDLAVQHVASALEKAALRLGADAETAKRSAVEQIHNFINQSRTNGKSWASEAYEWAKEIGYQPKGQANGETDAQRKAREDIERINAGGAAGHSLRGAGGGGVGEQLTSAKLAGMSEGDYFNTRKAYIAKNGKDAWDKLTNT